MCSDKLIVFDVPKKKYGRAIVMYESICTQILCTCLGAKLCVQNHVPVLVEVLD